jgi:hypothetical protein
VLRVLAAPEESTRSLAANALRFVVGPGMVEALAARVRDPSIEVRVAVLDPLALLGTAEAVEALIPACQDEVDDVALRALRRLGDVLGEEFSDDDGEEEAWEAWERHRGAFRAGTCHRWGHPIQLPRFVQAWQTQPDRRVDIVAELTIITGLPIADLTSKGGIEVVQDALFAPRYVEGGLYKWGRLVPIP